MNNRRNKIKKRLKIFAYGSVLIVLGLTIIANKSIENSTKELTFSDAEKIEKHKTGLLPGTSMLLKNGNVNLYFAYRIDAAVELYQKGIIENIIVSGDNSQKDYNEPLDMKNELMKRGIPENKIYLDYAGFRTFDSVIRAKEIFGQNSFVVISQKFHTERAVFIAIKNDIQAVGFNAKDVDSYNGFKTKLREKLARVKVFTDILLNVKPKFSGDKIEIK